MIDPITQYILEQESINNLPPDLVSFLLTKLYPANWKGKHTIKDIEDAHNNAMEWTDKRHASFIKSLKLYGVFSYVNGDSAWYSFKNKKVYDYNHSMYQFNDQMSGQDKKNGWPAVNYKQWMKDTITKKHIDAWRQA